MLFRSETLLGTASGSGYLGTVLAHQNQLGTYVVNATPTANNIPVLDANAKLPTTILTNGVKFSVYRAAALNSAPGTPVAFDTALFDTGSNVDITTNKGRFTVPANGFYYFNAKISWVAGSKRTILSLYVGGVEKLRGLDVTSGANYGACVVSGLIQLSATNYVETTINYADATALDVGASFCYFQGFLVSAT